MAAAVDVAARPNILVCGTPGTGKTTLAGALAEKLGFTHVNIGDLIRERGFHAGRDEAFDAFILDEAFGDQILDELEPVIAAGGVIVDFHTVDFFPERFFQLVLVLQTDNTVLFDRLVARGYSERKRTENVEAEIHRVVLEQALESYNKDIVQVVDSDTMEQMEETVARTAKWVAEWSPS